MEKRRDDLLHLKAYTEEIDNEITMILQSLQWDRKHLLEKPVMAACRYDTNHKMPPDKIYEHEKECFLKLNEYSKEDCLLPDPLDHEAPTLVKLTKNDIEQIIGNAARNDPLFKKVCELTIVGCEPIPLFTVGSDGVEPWSLQRLQSSYSADERRAIHDAVVSAVPSCHDLADLALLSGAEEQGKKVILSRTEILAELRNMRRRRAKYRVAAKTRNYSDVLRDVIKTQMEHYNDAQSEATPSETTNERNFNKQPNDNRNSDNNRNRSTSRNDRDRFEQPDNKVVPRPIKIKRERDNSTERNEDYGRERSDKDRYEDGRKDRYEKDHRGHKDRSRERRREERSHRYVDESRKRVHEDDTRRKIKHETRSDNDNDAGIDYTQDKERSHKHREIKEKQNKSKHRDRSRERRRDERDNYETKDRDEGRSRKRNQERKERRTEIINIKQERDDSYEREEHRRRDKYDRHRSDRSGESYSMERSIKERKSRYCEKPEEVYDPNKKIKVEK